jgi:hypothetical protein
MEFMVRILAVSPKKESLLDTGPDLNATLSPKIDFVEFNGETVVM